ncbi:MULTISPECIES: intradiol ring-cleavage dioxygenase [Deinococcus]|uniref:Intradiol ring-cleavage dioxygenase n=1 Tax=Deinococcus rufus TaxID=2136097 RepID=A0ABV7Z847_9DEIO|nr:intradiol ring-cleavage dioxygenase [Deinococcus sp. AB2017081]WQE94468.1 intradiol ring-cleavage dioxygenase [Deinococcus sp. AB2017081]
MNPSDRPDLSPLHLDGDTDDGMTGTILSRRRALRLLGLGGGAAALGAGGVLAQRGGGPGGMSGAGGTSAGTSGAAGLPGCVVRPAMTEGPYFVESEPRRSDIRRDSTTGRLSAGVPLTLSFVVSRVAVGGCTPRSGVLIDVWHCDALGVYSDVQGNTGDFLRGSQVTDAQGRARFTTIYPGWYQGRAVHIHFKLRPLDASGRATGEFTSQLFFPENVNTAVFARAPYRQKGTKADTPNATDGIYRNGGNQLLLDVKGDASRGYAATFDVGLNIG